MRQAHELDAGERKAEYAEAIQRLETELAARKVWFPLKPSQANEKRWSRDRFLEMPPELVLRSMTGSPLPPELIEVERLVRAERFSDAARAMERISDDGNQLMDGIGIAERGANVAWERGEPDAAIALLRLAKLGYQAYASGATSGAEGMGRMVDVERVETLIRQWERAKKK